MNKKDENHRGYTLATGKKIYSNQCIIGINPLCETIYEGYDGIIDRLEWNPDTNQEEHQLTDEERIEVAEYAIELWKQYISKIQYKQ